MSITSAAAAMMSVTLRRIVCRIFVLSTGGAEERPAKTEQNQPRPDGFETIRNCHNDEAFGAMTGRNGE